MLLFLATTLTAEEDFPLVFMLLSGFRSKLGDRHTHMHPWQPFDTLTPTLEAVLLCRFSAISSNIFWASLLFSRAPSYSKCIYTPSLISNALVRTSLGRGQSCTGRL